MKANGITSARVLVVSDEPTTCCSLPALLEASSYETETAVSSLEAVERVHHEPSFDLVLLDLMTADMNGLQTLRRLRELNPDLAIIVLSSSGNTEQFMEAIRLGAQDYLTKPYQASELDSVLKRHLGEPSHTPNSISATEAIEELSDDLIFVAASPVMQKIRTQAELLANINVPVLLLGESGTGKESVARLIYKLSSRAHNKFLKVNCAALPGELLESELFGYERGAFTGAMRAKPGKFELCNKGTILLDEIGEVPAHLQAKLLHVLQDKRFFRLGGETTVEVDVRILAATNINIDQAIAEKKLREDLYYRLSAFTIHLPPLRERQEEIPLLLRHLMNRVAECYERSPRPFPAALLQACLRYPWPGNLRELENFVKRYLVMGDASLAMSELQPKSNGALVPGNWEPKSEEPTMREANANGAAADEGNHRNLKSLVRSLKNETEIHAITRALEETNWNRKHAAQLLNISYRGLLYKIRQHQIAPTFGTHLWPFLRNNGER